MKKTISILLTLLMILTIFCLPVCAASNIKMPKQVKTTEGTSTYQMINGILCISGSADTDGTLFPFLLGSNTVEQNINLMQYGSSYTNFIDIFIALPNSALLHTIKPKKIEILNNYDNDNWITVFDLKYLNGNLSEVHLYDFINKASQIPITDLNNPNREVGVKYYYDKMNKLIKLSETALELYDDGLPSFEFSENTLNYSNGKLSKYSAGNDSGYYTNSNMKYDADGRIKSYRANTTTLEQQAKSTVNITYTGNKPEKVVFKPDSNKNLGSTTNFTYTNGNLTQISTKEKYFDQTYSNIYSYIY